MEELIGTESVEKCFTEYIMLTIAKAKKYDELQGKSKKNDTNFDVFGEGEDD